MVLLTTVTTHLSCLDLSNLIKSACVDRRRLRAIYPTVTQSAISTINCSYSRSSLSLCNPTTPVTAGAQHGRDKYCLSEMLGNYYWTSTVILCHNVVFKFHHSTDDERNTNEVCYDSRTIFMRTVRAPKSGYDKNLHFVYWQNLCQSYRFRSEQQTFAIKQQLSRLETPQFRIFRSPCRRRIKLEHTF